MTTGEAPKRFSLQTRLEREKTGPLWMEVDETARNNRKPAPNE
jgi:hypothetical protein